MNNTGKLKDIVFLIPSLDPDEKMPLYVKALIKANAKHIVIVNDGSKKENLHFFDELKSNKEVVILNHIVNQGKGRALKTGINYVLDNYKNIKGIVTADADGQHSVKDTISCAKRLLLTNTIVFGTRNFNEDIVPFKSRNGNKITTFVFKLLFGKQINDTQTGLRGLPTSFLYKCLELPGERFEYEIAMLIKAVDEKIEIYEEPIETIYFESNRATHFNTFKDSFRIYKIMLNTFIKFSFSSVVSALLDLSLYTLLLNGIFNSIHYKNGILFSTIIARICSSYINFLLNKNVVFVKKKNNYMDIVKYYCLVVIQMFVSWFSVYIVYNITKFNSTIIKIIIDTIIFVINYNIQKRFVFTGGG